MAKVPTIPFLLLRRWYKAAAESVRGQKAAAITVRTRTTESGSRTVNNTAANYDELKEAFWMRTPKTGNWISETHFDELRDPLGPTLDTLRSFFKLLPFRVKR